LVNRISKLYRHIYSGGTHHDTRTAPAGKNTYLLRYAAHRKRNDLSVHNFSTDSCGDEEPSESVRVEKSPPKLTPHHHNSSREASGHHLPILPASREVVAGHHLPILPASREVVAGHHLPILPLSSRCHWRSWPAIIVLSGGRGRPSSSGVTGGRGRPSSSGVTGGRGRPSSRRHWRSCSAIHGLPMSQEIGFGVGMVI
jgi:hypothetical protein